MRHPKATSSGQPMTGETYKGLLAKLDLSYNEKKCWDDLGISRRSSYRYANEDKKYPIPFTVSELLREKVENKRLRALLAKLGMTDI